MCVRLKSSPIREHNSQRRKEEEVIERWNETACENNNNTQVKSKQATHVKAGPVQSSCRDSPPCEQAKHSDMVKHVNLL